MIKFGFILIVVIFLSSARSQTWSGSNQLHPVHGLYVKPSSDGTTGDLYVAATEDSGTNVQWLTDQPINLLSQQTNTIPSQPTYPTPDDNSNPHKRAILNPAVAPVQYAYALPYSPEGNHLPYPYALQSSVPETTPAPQCEKATALPYNPYQYFYPHMMQAYANAKSILKETGMSDEKVNSAIPQASPFWPSGYTYSPYPMYVMVDPSAWTHQAQTAQAAATTESTPKLK